MPDGDAVVAGDALSANDTRTLRWRTGRARCTSTLARGTAVVRRKRDGTALPELNGHEPMGMNRGVLGRDLGIVVLVALVGIVLAAVQAGRGDGEEGVDGCSILGKRRLNDIASTLEADGLWLSGGHWVRSEENVDVYFIAADVQGPEIDGPDNLGVWLSYGDSADVGLVFAVNWVAREYSVAPDADTTDPRATMALEGAVAARDCAERALQGRST